MADARRLQASRSLIRHFREDGSGTLSVELPREELALVLQALELIGGQLADDPTRPLFAKAADALQCAAAPGRWLLLRPAGWPASGGAAP